MPSKSVHNWMSHEIMRLTLKWERYKPMGSGYNRIQPIVLSRSVTQMLNNPLPVQDQIGSSLTRTPQQQPQQQYQQQNSRAGSFKAGGVLSRPESEWEEVYPAVRFTRGESCELYADNEAERKFAYYRSCSTRLT